MGESRVNRVLAFLDATESLCTETDVVAAGCVKALATIDSLLFDIHELALAFAALDVCLTHCHELASE